MNVAEPPASEVVTAIYELPVPIWVSCAALGGTFPSGYGRVQFDVVMPQDRAPVGGPPVIDGVEITQPLDGELVVWTTEYAADVPEEFQPATALLRIVITAVEAPTDTARSWQGPDRQLGSIIKFWFDRVRSWVEICTGQDLDPGHRVYDAETVGAGLTFIAPPHEGDLGLQLTTRRIRPVTAAEWRWILAAVRDGKALELALVRIMDERIEEIPESQRKGLAARPSLGRYIDVAKASGFEFDVTFEDLKRLNDARNDAVHRAQAPDSFETLMLLRVVGNFLASSARIRGASAGTD